MKLYALGYAFNVKDILFNFPYKKLKTNCKKCLELIGDAHRSILLLRIFRESFKLVILDIIERNVTFWLPLTGGRQCNMHMKRVQGIDFLRLRRAGKWEDIDIVKSNFSGYEIGFFMLGKRTPRVKTVYVNKLSKEIISKYTNLGKQYGDGNIDTRISDYYDLIYELFPEVQKEDIKKILSFSWKSLYLHNSYGGDTVITGNDFWCYIGRLLNDPLKHFNYYVKKLATKLKVLYKRKKIPWNGYYYFALTDTLYQEYIRLKNKKGRPRKYFKFGTVFLYLILEECKISEHSKQYIFRVPFISLVKIKYLVRDFVSSNAELIIERSPLKFKDILVNNNKYELL